MMPRSACDGVASEALHAFDHGIMLHRIRPLYALHLATRPTLPQNVTPARRLNETLDNSGTISTI